MGLSVGIVGLPNVGKSTIFNALTAAGAESANYPFCTIEPNVGIVPVVDRRLDGLAEIAASPRLSPEEHEVLDEVNLLSAKPVLYVANVSEDEVDCETYLRLGGETPARAAGKVRSEGKEYEVQDGDVILFRFNV